MVKYRENSIIKIPFWFNTRPENCKVDYLKALKRVGAYRISFGIECGNPDFRQKVFRSILLD